MEKRKDEVVNFLCDRDFKKELVKLADKCDMSVGEAIRQCILLAHKTLIEKATKDQAEE